MSPLKVSPENDSPTETPDPSMLTRPRIRTMPMNTRPRKTAVSGLIFSLRKTAARIAEISGPV